MNLLDFSDSHHKFRKRLRAFLEEEVAPFNRQWELDGIVPREVWRRMGRRGFLCTALDRRFGGFGGDFLYSLMVIEELARIGQNGLGVPLHSDIVVPYIDSFGSPAICEKYLPACADGSCITAVAMTEPAAGSDLAAMETTAVEAGPDVILNGTKTFISNGLHCDLVVLAARDPNAANPHEALSLYLVEDGTPGFTKGRKLAKMGLHSQDTAELFFSNCRIPAENRLGDRGAGFLMLMEKLQQERLVVAIWAVAAARYIHGWLLENRASMAVNGRLKQSVQFALVEMATEITISRTFMEHVVAADMGGEQVIAETSMAKYWTTDMVKRMADRAVDLVGQEAMRDDHPMNRMFRDMRVMSIFAGTNEIMKGIAAKFMGL